MNRMLLLFAAASVAAVSAAAPAVSDVTISQQATGKVVVNYVLSGDPAVVTLSVLRRNGATWSPVPDENVVSLLGEVNCVVTPSAEPKTVYWNAPADLTDAVADEFKAQVEAWPLDALPEFMSLGLTWPYGGTANDQLRFYRSKAAIPGGITDRRYKTDTLLMRKICAKDVVWMMGDGSSGDDSSKDVKHYVKLSHDYYIGVYEFTFGQYSNFLAHAQAVCGKSVTTSAVVSGSDIGIAKILANTKDKGAMAEDIAVCPLTFISVDTIRGNTKTGDYRIDAGNKKHDVEPGRLLDCLRCAAGHSVAFDVPTEAEWEYACNAGTFQSHYYGSSFDASQGWTLSTFGGTSSTNSMPVGLCNPNPWDLYDMYGNAAEMCLDPWVRTVTKNDTDKEAAVVDPCGDGATDESIKWRRSIRGGAYSVGGSSARTHYRYRMPDGNSPYPHIGFRVVCPAVVTAE